MAQTDLNSLAEPGTPAEIWAELMDFTLSAQRLSEPTQRLIDEYPQQWGGDIRWTGSIGCEQLQGRAVCDRRAEYPQGQGHRALHRYRAQDHDPLSRMITGRFGDSTGRPYVEAIVWFPRFQVKAQVSFLVDTGADISLINPVDGIQAGIFSPGELGNWSQAPVRPSD